MSVIAVNKLMEETRRLAANYYQTTQQTLPVSSELGKYDAIRLLNLNEVKEAIKGVDATDGEHQYQIKSRVVFDSQKSNYRVGQLNFDGEWDVTLLVLLTPDYQPQAVYAATREQLDEGAQENPNANRAKRGAMSVAKFKALGRLRWSNGDD